MTTTLRDEFTARKPLHEQRDRAARYGRATGLDALCAVWEGPEVEPTVAVNYYGHVWVALVAMMNAIKSE